MAENEKEISGFSKLGKREKIAWLAKNFLYANPVEVVKEFAEYWHDNVEAQKLLDGFSENTLTNFPVPFGIAPNFKINGEILWGTQTDNKLIAPIDSYSVQVHHFKWDSTCVERIKAVADIRKDYAFSKEYLKMYQAIRRNNFEIDINISNPCHANIQTEIEVIHVENNIYKDKKGKFYKLINF